MSFVNLTREPKPKAGVVGDDGEWHPLYDGERTVLAEDPKGSSPFEALFDDPTQIGLDDE